jgi:hypothetical protein
MNVTDSRYKEKHDFTNQTPPKWTRTHLRGTMYSKKICPRLPGNVDEAAELLITDLLTQHLQTLSHMTDEQFELLCDRVSPYLLEEFQVWHGNDQLLGSCFLQDDDDNQNDPARIILSRVKKKLQDFNGFLVIT